MRRSLFFPLVPFACALGAATAEGQVRVDTTAAGTAKLAQGNFAVPAAPALKMLDLEDSKLLRPSSVRALTTQLASATGNATFIPSAFAVEVSPLLLINGDKLSLRQYRANRLWYRMRASVATKRGDAPNARTQLALGLRLALQDDSDLRTNDRYIAALLKLTDWERDSIDVVVRTQAALGIPATDTLTSEQQRRIDAEVARVLRDSVGPLRAARIPALVDSLKRAAEEAEWNANAFDVAVGIVASSVDSTGGGPRFDGVAAWATKGWRVARHAQLLLGARGAYERDLTDTVNTDRRRSGDAILRLYAGTNMYKLLVEGQATGRQSSAPTWLVNGGGELQLSSILWITGTVGWETGGARRDDGRFVSSFKLKLNPPL